jgi:SAM-dependent methyltransferase
MQGAHFCGRENGRVAQSVVDWQRQALGARIVAHEREVLGGMVQDLFGYQLLQLGELGPDLEHLQGCPVGCKTLVSHGVSAGAVVGLVAEPRSLPVAGDSIDAVILPHTLDFSPDPHQVLREVERVLIPEGRVVVVGFNPFSLWGIWRLFGRWRGAVPWCANFVSYPRLHDWLSLMGLDVERMDVLEFRPPMRTTRFEAVERVGRRVWPMLAGIYVVRAVKRVSRVTPLQPRWSRLRVLGARAGMEPTARIKSG